MHPFEDVCHEKEDKHGEGEESFLRTLLKQETSVSGEMQVQPEFILCHISSP